VARHLLLAALGAAWFQGALGAGRGSIDPLVPVADVDLPGAETRFDYQDIDVGHGYLILTHMGGDAVVVVQLADGSLVKRLTGIPTPRGVVVAESVGRIFVSSAPDRLVIIDSASLVVLRRVAAGRAPDSVSWDPEHQVVGVSDQRDGAVSLIAGAGDGARRQVHLGMETGNVVYDAARARFWVTVVNAAPPDQLVSIDPVTAGLGERIDLPGCDGAHGLRLHPDGQSALVACEASSSLVRVELGSGAIVSAKVGKTPDVLAIDPGTGWLYVAAESGDLTVFDIGKQGLAPVGSQHVGDAAHSVAVDAATNRVFFPLKVGARGAPALRIMLPRRP
jgi:DNA-binding beta-propeller fold protein YncE